MWNLHVPFNCTNLNKEENIFEKVNDIQRLYACTGVEYLEEVYLQVLIPCQERKFSYLIDGSNLR